MEIDKTAGLRRVAWDLRRNMPPQAEGQGGQGGFFGRRRQAPLVEPGRYHARLGTKAGGTVTPVGEPQTFLVVQIPQSEVRGGRL
jgi:hypothetical protein